MKIYSNIFFYEFYCVRFAAMLWSTVSYYLYVVWGWGPSSVFCVWLFSGHSTICGKDRSSSIELSWNPCWKSIDHRCEGVFLNSQVNFIDLYVCLYAITTLSWSHSFIISFESGSVFSGFIVFWDGLDSNGSLSFSCAV